LEYYLFKSHPLHGMGLESFHDLWRTVVEKLIHVAESEEGLTDYFSPHDGEPSLYSAGVQGKSLQALFESLRNQVAETTEAPYILLLLTRYHHAILQIHALKKELHGLTEVIKNREDIVKSQESCLLAEQLFPRGQKTSREKLASLKTAIKHSKRGVVAVQTESKKVSSLIRKGEEDLATFRCGMQELSDFQQEDFNSKPSKSKSRLSKSKKESSAELELQCLRPTTASLFFNSSEKQGAAAVSARDTAHLHAD
jgi:hypothetical protein